MRILHFCNYADKLGGAEVYAQALVEAQRARGHEVSLFGASPEREEDVRGLRVIRRPLYDPARLVLDAAARNALLEYLQRFRPEVVHVHNVFSVALELLEVLGRAELPLVHTVHDFQLLCPNSWCVHGDGAPCPGGAGAKCFAHACQQNYAYDAWGVLLAGLRQRLVSGWDALALAPSSYMVERLRANGWNDVRRLPYFIDFPALAPGPARQPFELLYVGRLEREKGVDVLLAALPALRAELPELTLTLLGGGSQEHALRQLAGELRLGQSVHFQSGVARAALPQHYARAALCVLPSIWTENSPLVAYECLRAGLPMLGSRIGGIPELIEPDCGLTFAPRDPADLARAALRFMRLPLAERERMSQAARLRAREHEPARHLDELEQLYATARTRARRPTPGPLADYPDLLAVLQALGDERRAQPPSAPAPLQTLRDLARSLGLPKILKN
ncbi:MAG: glycosyltransferase [Planctomycetes bacterium]|nr:glycosyltransferase [Planctomycetota bacterium]